MKRIIAKIIVLVSIVGCLNGCNAFTDNNNTVVLKSYINYYLDFPEEWSITYDNNSQTLCFVLVKSEGFSAGKFIYDYLPVVASNLGGDWDMTKPLSVKHYELSVENGDTTFNYKSTNDELFDVFGGFGYDWVCVYYRHLTSIDITSNADYDADHPAGTPLNDLVCIRFRSPKSYIDGGYKTQGWRSEILEYELNELQPDDTKLMWAASACYDPNFLYDYDFALYFKQAPTAKSQHTLSINLTTNDNVTYTQFVSVDFGTGEE